VRRYSSDDEPEPLNERDLDVPTYWVRPARMLASSPGMHRFVWDLYYTTPRAVRHDFPIAAIVHDTPREPRGVIAVPGSYTVRLTVNGQMFSKPLTIKMDPRAHATPLALTQQFSLARKIVALMNQSYDAAQTAEQAGQQSANDLKALNENLATALDVVEGADRAPTVQAVRAVADLQRRLQQSIR
jgi:hypothetical protein